MPRGGHQIDLYLNIGCMQSLPGLNQTQPGSRMIRISSPCLVYDPKAAKNPRHLEQIHGRAIKTGEIRDPLVSAEILRRAALSSERDILYARSLFDQMPEPNRFSWNTIIRASAESDDETPLAAIDLFCEMLHCDHARPDKYTFPSVLKACATIGAIQEGEQIHARILKLGFIHDGYVLTNLLRVYALCGRMEDACLLAREGSELSFARTVSHNVVIDGYFRLGMIDRARRVFDEMPERSVVSWNGMISGYAQAGRFTEAVDVFHRMQLAGVSPDYVTLVSVLPAISRLGDLGLGERVHRYAEVNGIEIDDVLGSALVDMYSKCGDIDNALEAFEGLPKSNPITWSALIGGLSMHGRAIEALDRFLVMESNGLVPTDVVFVGILNACSHAGLVDRGRFYFDRMVSEYGLTPSVEHYGCMVDMLARAGLLQEAEDLVASMPMKPDDVIYKALLSACTIHGNLEIGARVADRLVELAPSDGGCNTLLSNFYASFGEWDDVSKARLRMEESKIRKDPGCSWITLNGETYQFVVGDDSHPRTKEIYSMLEEMTNKLRETSYVPETTQMLLNIDEEEDYYAS